MVDKKACRIRKRKYKINGAVFATRISAILLLIVTVVTIYGKINERNMGEVIETSAYINQNGISSMVNGIENGGVYTSSVKPVVASCVKEATLFRNGEEIRFKSGKKISKVGSYILTLEDNNGNVDTVYFDIEM